MEKNFENEIFHKNKKILNLIETLKNNDTNFNISKNNICTFDAESLEDIAAYEIFFNKFQKISNDELKFTDIEIDDCVYDEYDEEEHVNFDELILKNMFENGAIDIEKLEFSMSENPISIYLKINGYSTSLDVEFMNDWFDYKLIYSLNEKLKELNYDKYFWFSNSWEECTIIYANQNDINKINNEMKKNKIFNSNTPFMIKEIKE